MRCLIAESEEELGSNDYKPRTRNYGSPIPEKDPAGTITVPTTWFAEGARINRDPVIVILNK